MELEAVRGILDCFGETSGLWVNLQKSSAAPIQCSLETLDLYAQAFPYPIKQLPCIYLGPPLSLKKLRKEDLHSILDKLARKLAFWKAKLLTKDDRVAFVQLVMTASVIYHLMVLDVDPWFLKAVDHLQRGPAQCMRGLLLCGLATNLPAKVARWTGLPRPAQAQCRSTGSVALVLVN
jgi:hypothetical protein